MWNYFHTYKRDGKGLRLFVFYLFVVETVETLLAMGVVFEPLIVENGKPQGTTILPYLLPSLPTLAVLVSTPVQLFTAWRIYVITKSYWMPGFISLCSMGSFGASFYTTERIARARLVPQKSKLTHPYFLLLESATDILTMGTLIYSLSRRRSHDKSTNLVLKKILRLALQTGSITTLFTLMDAISVYVWPKTSISFAFDYPIPKLYSNALLSTLNARSRLSQLVNLHLNDSELSSFRAQARNTGLFDEEDDDDNPLFWRERIPAEASGTPTLTKSSGSGKPITFAKPNTTVTTTSGGLDFDESETDLSPGERQDDPIGMTGSEGRKRVDFLPQGS